VNPCNLLHELYYTASLFPFFLDLTNRHQAPNSGPSK
jgi:hypothetical protein